MTAFELAQSSMTSILSRVVPNEISLTTPAFPSLAAVRSSNRGTMRPLVAIAMSYRDRGRTTSADAYRFETGPREARTSISGPPTHRTAGKSFCIKRWFASSSKPHWQMTRLAPVSLTCLIML